MTTYSGDIANTPKKLGTMARRDGKTSGADKEMKEAVELEEQPESRREGEYPEGHDPGTEADPQLDREEVVDLIDGLLEMLDEEDGVQESGTPENLLYQSVTLIRSFVDKGVLGQEELDDVYDFITDAWEIGSDDAEASEMVGTLPDCSQRYFDRKLDKLIDKQIEEYDSLDEIFRTVIRGGKRTRKRFLNPSEKRKFLTARRRSAFRKLARMRRSRRWKVKASTKAKIKRSLRMAKSIHPRR